MMIPFRLQTLAFFSMPLVLLLIIILYSLAMPGQFTNPISFKQNGEESDQQQQSISEQCRHANQDRIILSKLLNSALKAMNALKCNLTDDTTSTGAWCRAPFEHGHMTDAGFANALAKMLKGQTVVSFGDGPGEYRRRILATGLVPQYDSYDGSPLIEEATNGSVKYLDLTVPHYGLPIYDWVLSVEVAEHIPQQFEEIYLGNLLRHARKGLVLSWAVPGQGGHAHVNERPAEYVVSLLMSKCFDHDKVISDGLRGSAGLGWLKNNVKVFLRRENCTLLVDDA